MWLFGSFVIRMNALTRGESNIDMIQHCRPLFVCLAMNDVWRLSMMTSCLFKRFIISLSYHGTREDEWSLQIEHRPQLTPAVVVVSVSGMSTTAGFSAVFTRPSSPHRFWLKFLTKLSFPVFQFRQGSAALCLGFLAAPHRQYIGRWVNHSLLFRAIGTAIYAHLIR